VIGGSGKKFFYHNDHQGTALAVTDELGNKVVERDFAPFGERIKTSDREEPYPDETEDGFTGKDFDEDIGLYYYNARWYDDSIGRFISEDSINDPNNNGNEYVYCGGNPVNRIDPTGHKWDGIFNLGPLKINVVQGLTNLAASYIPGFAELQALGSFSKLIASRKNPLVFVHGFNSSWTCWTDFLSKMTGDAEIEGKKTIKDLAEEFDNKDTDPKRKAEILSKVQAKLKESQIYIFDYSDDNKASPKKLGEQFKDFMKENKLGKNTDVITHSMGGLVVREAVEFQGVELNKLAMIAPPNQGSDLAYNFHRASTGIDEIDSIQVASKTTDWSLGYMDPASKGLQKLNDEKSVYWLKQRVNQVAIFAGERDDAVALNRVKIPFTDYPVTTYQAGLFGSNRVHKEIWPIGQHNALLSSIFVQRDVAQFLYGQ
ncbi:MAG: RHS repeat-associated core domain-containing protein, partial [Bacteroidota bacterium]